MKNIVVIAVVAVLAASGGVMASIWLVAEPAVPALAESGAGAEVEALLARIESLERQIEELQSIEPLVAVPAESQQTVLAAGRATSTSATSAVASVAPPAAVTRRSDRAARREAEIREKLVQAGWTQTEIDEVYRKRDLAALQTLEEEHRAQREMMQRNPEMAAWRNYQSPLRKSMSEDKYESYLAAMGRPTSARVGKLLPGSAGDAAGLREGDRIVRYGDQRIFNGAELHGATLEGEYGQAVTIEVERDGSTFFLTLPRGPIGIGSFRYRE